MLAFRSIRRFGLALCAALLALGLGKAVAQAQTYDEKVQQGARLYAQNCAVCHGADGQGRIGATLSKDWPSIRPDLTVRTIIENGVPGSVMPAWSKTKGGPLSSQEIDALVAFILTWQTGEEPAFTPMPTPTIRPAITPPANVSGDPNRGAALFAQNCAMCHGPNGEGRIGATLSQAWPALRPDLTVKTAIQNGVQGSVMPAWSQEKGGPLSDSEINDLVSFILSLPAGPAPVQPTAALPAGKTLPWLRGWAGAALFLVLFAVIIAAAWVLQRKK